MKKKCILVILGGAALTALSFLFSYFGEAFDGVRYAVMSIGIIAAASGALVLALYIRPKKRILQQGAQYGKKAALLSAPERDFLYVLRAVIDMRRYEIFPQVPLAAVIDKTSAAYRNELFRIIDFCVLDAASFEPLLLIELNDASHNRDGRKLRDEKVNAICSAARIPLVTFNFAEASDVRLVKDKIKKYIR